MSAVFVFALAAGFEGGALNAGRVEAMMGGLPVAPADGVRTAHGPRASASIGRWIVVARDAAAGPSWDPVRGVLFAGDVRLYNRPELIGELGEAPALLAAQSDLELARLAYLKWGEDAPRHLVGDFAFAAWDERAGRVFAARDHFGVRPLLYRRLPDGIAVASDVHQLLALVERPADEICGEQILDALLHRSTDCERTYFRGIKRVPAGHALVADANGLRQFRYWEPPIGSASDERVSYADHCEQLRTIFARAVRDRLESVHPIVAHSSGGFDSSTIIMAADRIYRDEPARPALTLVSGVVPGHAADESRYMDAIAASVGFPEARWKIVAEAAPAKVAEVSRAAPALRHGLSGGPRGDLDIARERGARVLLSGVLGDSLWHAQNIRRDMVRHGRWPQAGYDVLRAGLNGLTFRRFVDAGLGLLPVEIADRAAHWLFDERPRLPDWMGPALRSTHAGALNGRRRDVAARGWPTHLLRGVWSQLTSPAAARVVEAFAGYAGEEGIELRLPHADVRLAEAILTIPWRQREPRGHHRRTGRDALGPLLPAAFAARVGQGPWTSVWAANARRNAITVAPFIEHGAWLSEPFVDRAIARAMLHDVRRGADADRPDIAILVTQFGALEAWIRTLFG